MANIIKNAFIRGYKIFNILFNHFDAHPHIQDCLVPLSYLILVKDSYDIPFDFNDATSKKLQLGCDVT